MNTKISVFTIFVGFALLFAGCSKDDENIPGGIEPPKTILDAFNAKYPDARDTEWTVNDDYYVIDFENNSLDNTAWFDHLGVWAMIKTDLPLTPVAYGYLERYQTRQICRLEDRGSRYHRQSRNGNRI